MALPVIVSGDYQLRASATGWVTTLPGYDPYTSPVWPALNICFLMLNIPCWYRNQLFPSSSPAPAARCTMQTLIIEKSRLGFI